MSSTTAVRKVLIADPAEKQRQSLCQYLREKGFDAIETPDGSKALSETLLRRPDVLVLDLGVAVLSAEKLVQILRTNPNTRAIPIFFTSDKEKNVPGFRHGVDEFIRKPFREEELFLRIQRNLSPGSLPESLTADSEISGNLSQIFLPDVWQMLAMQSKSGVIQIESDRITGSIYIEKGEIISAVSQNIGGEKALFRLIPLKQGKFRFIPGKVDIRRTVQTSSQQAILEGLRQYDEIKALGSELPGLEESVMLVKDAKAVASGGGAVREILLLAEFCTKVEEIVNNCTFPDLTVYETLLHLKKRGVLRIGNFESRPVKSEFLPPEDLARLRTRLEEKGSFAGGNVGRIVLFLPDPSLLEESVRALGTFREFEVDKAFFSLRRDEGYPTGMFGQIRAGEGASILLYAFPYLRSTSPLWYVLAPHPTGIIAFLKDEVSSSLEGLTAVSDYTRGVDAKVVLAVMGKTFTNFGLGENTLRLFQSRLEKLGCTLKVQEMEQLSPEEIRDAFGQVVRQFLEEGTK